MRPEAQGIAVPPFPPGTDWIGPEPAPVERVCSQGLLLVHFVDVAHFSSVRTLPYLTAWCKRYGELGLTVLGVNSPRFPFSAEVQKVTAALARLGVAFPVAVDADYAIWHAYGCEGWPSLFLWGTGGALRWFHFGEGEYAATERAVQEELRALRPDADLPEPLAPLRPSDAPDALVARPSVEVFPGGSASEPWQPAEREAPLELDYAAGGAWVTVDGRDILGVSLDGGPETKIEVEAPGAYEVASHPRHESHRLALRPSAGLEVYAIGFAAGVP
jgi:hypothetical protein